jgi:thiol-disulfide isomerase/thioredoxin
LTGPLLGTYIALWVLVGVLSVAVFALYHHFGEMYLNSREGRERQGPDRFAPVYRLSVRDVLGKDVEIPTEGKASYLVFASTDCDFCAKLRPELIQLAREHEDLALCVICAGHPEAVQRWADGLHRIAHVIPDPDQRIAARYQVTIAPFVVGVNSDGIVQTKGLVNDREGLRFYAGVTLSSDESRTELAAMGTR